MGDYKGLPIVLTPCKTGVGHIDDIYINPTHDKIAFLYGEIVSLLEDDASLPEDDDEFAALFNCPDLFVHPLGKRKSVLKAIWHSSFTGMVFYILMAVVAMSILSFKDTKDGGAPRDIFGFSFMNVLSSSMQSVIPKGSFVLVQRTDPATLQIGDDITYLRSRTTTFTHRITALYENYADTGKRGFETQGVDNSAPDDEIVIADNVIGKVIFHSLPLGMFFVFVRDHILLSSLMFVLAMGIFIAIRMVFSPKRKDMKKSSSDITQNEGRNPK